VGNNFPYTIMGFEPGTTKNKDGRLVYMSPELLEMVRTQEERVRALERELGRPIPWLPSRP